MKNTKNNIIPSEIINIVKTIENGGFQAFLVGGCVRDIFLGRDPKDWDITTNAKPEEIQKLFPKTVYENDFGTVIIVNEDIESGPLRTVEVTPYRIESGYKDKRHPDEIKFSDKIEDDLKRRDFTINAIAISLSDGAIKDIIDLYGGFKDIKDKTIRTVGNPQDRFNEDALRMIRAVRLAVELDFKIEDKTLKSIKDNSSALKDISKERIRDEFVKIILSKEPKRGIEMLHDTDLLLHVTPELEKGIGVTQNQAHSYDVWEHLLRTLQHSADKQYSLEIRLAALFHDIGKPRTKSFSRESGQITFYAHEIVGSRETRKILENMKFPRETIDKVTKLIRWHMFFSDTEQITLSAVRRMIVNVGKENIWDLMNVRLCDRIGTGRPKESPYRLRKYHAMIEEALRDPISVGMLKTDGKRIMEVCNLKPGPKIGYILHALFQEVLDKPEQNTVEYLDKKSLELSQISDDELKKLGEVGKDRKKEEEEKDIQKIYHKHHVQ